MKAKLPPLLLIKAVLAARWGLGHLAGQSSSTTRASLLSPLGSGSSCSLGCSVHTGCTGRNGRRSPWTCPPPARPAPRELSAAQSPLGRPSPCEEAGGFSLGLGCSPGLRQTRCGCQGQGGASILRFQLEYRNTLI